VCGGAVAALAVTGGEILHNVFHCAYYIRRVCVCGFCNMCTCVGFVMCGCFGNMYTVL
jgi:hypothetical protein